MKLIFNRIFTACSLVSLGALLLTGCATTDEPAFTSGPAIETGGSNGRSVVDGSRPSSEDPAGYKYKKSDLVVLTFSGTGTDAKIEPHSERVKEDGNITLPLIGAVKAEGKTAGELQKEVHDRYVPKYYVRMTVVAVPPVNDLFYYVIGEVRAPGAKNHLPGTTLTKAISTAGGLTDYARKGSITITREDGTKIKVDYNKAIKRSDADVRILPYDSINVPRRRF